MNERKIQRIENCRYWQLYCYFQNMVARPVIIKHAHACMHAYIYSFTVY